MTFTPIIISDINKTIVSQSKIASPIILNLKINKIIDVQKLL